MKNDNKDLSAPENPTNHAYKRFAGSGEQTRFLK